jgi:phage shock protein PspC (stress-responsive transcriptional regulator)
VSLQGKNMLLKVAYVFFMVFVDGIQVWGYLGFLACVPNKSDEDWWQTLANNVHIDVGNLLQNI